MPDTIFGKILRGEIPCHKVYEDERVFAFLDINPLSRGHTLVIPREAAVRLDELSEESAEALGRALPRIARAIVAATGARDYNVLQNNGPRAHQAVPHVHFHIIPKADDGSGLGLGWRTQPLDPEEARKLAEDLAARLAGA
jgi:histidine triad (HIT) family protein